MILLELIFVIARYAFDLYLIIGILFTFLALMGYMECVRDGEAHYTPTKVLRAAACAFVKWPMILSELIDKYSK